MNLNECFPVTELQVGICFRFDFCIERSNGVPFPRRFFVRLAVLPFKGFEVTHPIFDTGIKLRTRLTDAFNHLVSNDNFHCQTPLKTPSLTYLAVKMPGGRSGCK